MSDKVRIKLNSKGIQGLLRSTEMQDTVFKVAERVRARCGDGYETDRHMTSGRALASVFTGTDAAAKDNSDSNRLLKAVSGK